MTRTTAVAVIALFACVAATAACGKSSDVARQEYMRSGDAYLAQQKYPEAVIQYRNALQKDPQFAEAHLKLAEIYERLGEVKNAIIEYVRAADLLPADADVQVKAANFLLLAQQFKGAKMRADRALAVAPNHVEAHIAEGNALAGLKDLDEAVRAIEGAIHESPDRSASYVDLGAVELARGNRDQAEAAFRRALELAPDAVLARLALANFYWRTGSLAAAERELKAALVMSPKGISANRALAVLYLATNRASDAEPHLKTVVDGSTQSSDRFVLADYYFSGNRIAEATALLKELAKAERDFSEATIRLSAIAARSGNTEGARTLLDEVLGKEPANVGALVARAKLLLGDKKYDEALAAAEAASKASPGSASAHYIRATVHSARQDWDEAAAAYHEVLKLDPRVNSARLELARLSLVRGKPGEAIQLAHEALNAQPGSAAATFVLARAMLAKGDAGGAEPHVKQLTQHFPKSASAQAEQGQLYALKGDVEHARAAYMLALTIETTNIEALAGLTSLDITANNPAAARARVDARLTANPTDPRLQLLAARLYMAIGDAGAAERSLRKVIELDPSQIDAYALLGQSYASHHRLDEARAEFERIAERHPKTAVGAQTVVGMILQMQNKPAEARARYEKALSLDAGAAVAANNLAWIYAEAGGNLDVALGLAQTAKWQLPNSPQVSDTLGWMYYKKGQARLAVPPLRESVDRSPTNAVYWYHLGLALAKSGDSDEARKALERALALNPMFADSADAQRVLASLKE